MADNLGRVPDEVPIIDNQDKYLPKPNTSKKSKKSPKKGGKK